MRPLKTLNRTTWVIAAASAPSRHDRHVAKPRSAARRCTVSTEQRCGCFSPLSERRQADTACAASGCVSRSGRPGHLAAGLFQSAGDRRAFDHLVDDEEIFRIVLALRHRMPDIEVGDELVLA